MTGGFALEPLGEPFMLRALAETALIGVSAGVIGCWVILYGYSYAGESISHSVLPGLVVAAALGAPILLGGIPAIAVAAPAIALVARQHGIGRDTAVAVVVTGMLGIGGALAAVSAPPRSLEGMLFGDVLATTGSDLLAAGGLAAVAVAVAAVLHPRILAVGFDPAGAAAGGLRPGAVETAVLVLLAGAVLVAVQGLGNLLAVAIVVAPAATARMLTDRVAAMMATSAALAISIGAAGLYASYYAGTAAGASIAAIAVATYLLVAGITRGGSRSTAGA